MEGQTQRRPHRLWLDAILVVAILLAAGAGLAERERRADGGDEGALLKDRWRVRLISGRVAEEIARQGYADNLAKYRDAGKLDNDPYFTELVGSVAEPLIVAAKELYPATRDWQWEWHFADTGELNAYCMAGGRIVVLSGLLADKAIGDDRGMLATILAHEISHAILQHSRQSIGLGWTAQGLAWTMAKSLKIGAIREEALVAGLKTAMLDPGSRVQEAEADTLGLELMSRAGFDPGAAVATWERMTKLSEADMQDRMSQKALNFLSDHPSDADRLARMKALQPRAQPLAARSKRWEWALQGIDDRQVVTLDKAATAFGLGNATFAVTEDHGVAQLAAKAENLPAKMMAAELDNAVWDTGLAQGGAIQMGYTAMLRAAGGWERLARIEKAWAGLRTNQTLPEDPSLLDRMQLSEEDRGYATETLNRIAAYLDSPLMARRLWFDVATSLSATRPKAAEALRQAVDTATAAAEAAQDKADADPTNADKPNADAGKDQ